MKEKKKKIKKNQKIIQSNKIIKPKRLRVGDVYFAGTDKDRTKQINTVFADKAVKVILCTKAGHGFHKESSG